MSEFSEAVESSLKGLMGVSSGVRPGCEECAQDHDVTLDELKTGWESGDTYDEPSFSAGSCGSCGSHFEGARHVWHALDDNTGTLYHFDDMCTDCVMYLANGDEPESWEG